MFCLPRRFLIIPCCLIWSLQTLVQDVVFHCTGRGLLCSLQCPQVFWAPNSLVRLEKDIKYLWEKISDKITIQSEDEGLSRKNLSVTPVCQKYVLNGTSMRWGDKNSNYKSDFFLFRNNVWYVNVYGLWINTILNIITPLIGILVMNVMVYMSV